MNEFFKKGIDFITNFILENNNNIEEEVKKIYQKDGKEAANNFRNGAVCGIVAYAKGAQYIENNPEVSNGKIVEAIKEIEDKYGKGFGELFLQGVAARKVINGEIHTLK